MATLIAIGTLIGAKIAAAGAAAAATATAHPILFTVGALSAAAGITGGVVGGAQAKKSARAQEDQLRLQEQAERTQAAIENEERQRRLRRVLGIQNAVFGGSGVDMSTGTPGVLAQDSFEAAARQQSQAGLFSDTRVSILGSQISDTRAAGNVAMTRGFLKAGQSLLNFGMGVAQMGSIPGAGGGVTRDPFNTGPLSGGDIFTRGVA